MSFPLWAALLSIIGGVVLMLSFVTCCVVRCFRPEGTRGPAWTPNKDGTEQTIRSFFKPSDDSWLRQAGGNGAPLAVQNLDQQ